MESRQIYPHPNLFQKKSGRYTNLSILSDYSEQYLLLYNIWPIKDEIVAVAGCDIYLYLFCKNGVYLVEYSKFGSNRDKLEIIDMLPRNIP
ncbi:MAG TPA: hypothetical protein PKN77_04930, partial [Caldisericia bacterium]|nr:hypothetical protein [Caldisericia bacterium]